MICVGFSGGLVYFVMRSRMDVRLARQREHLAAMRASLNVHKEHLEATIRSAEQVARSGALDDLLSDLRVEERHYMREHRALFTKKRSIIRQERMYFRNIPLSNWVEHEMPVEDGADVEQLAQTMAIFNSGLLPTQADAPPPGRKLLR